MSEQPPISVVVSTRNRAARLSRLLESLRAQSIGLDAFEVVVVDDASTDETPSVLDREQRRDELRLKTISLPRAGGPARGRNAGWRATGAPLIAFTDDDCEADPRWLEALAASARANPRMIVQGRTEPAPDELDRVSVFSRTIKMTELNSFYNTCNIAYPHRLLEELEGFDEELFGRDPGGEDTDLAWRAIANGADAVFADDALVYHAVNQLGPIGALRFSLRWSDTMAVFARHPGMREQLWRGVFWKRSHELLLRAVLGLALARRFPPAALLAYPYARDVVRRTRSAGSPALYAPYVAAQDVVETFATIRGAAKHRVPVL